jgi:hypothetical protein
MHPLFLHFLGKKNPGRASHFLPEFDISISMANNQSMILKSTACLPCMPKASLLDFFISVSSPFHTNKKSNVCKIPRFRRWGLTGLILFFLVVLQFHYRQMETVKKLICNLQVVYGVPTLLYRTTFPSISAQSHKRGMVKESNQTVIDSTCHLRTFFRMEIVLQGTHACCRLSYNRFNRQVENNLRNIAGVLSRSSKTFND